MADLASVKTLNQLYDSTDIMYTDRRIFYLKENYLAELWANASVFTNFSAQCKTINDSPDVDYKMFEHKAFWVDNFKAYYTSGGTTLAADTADAGILINTTSGGSSGPTRAGIVGTVVEIWNAAETAKKAVAIVTAASTSTSGDTVTIRPVWVGSTTSQVAGDVWHVIGSASEESSTSPAAISDDITYRWNSCQEFETPVEMSNLALKAKMRPVNEWSRLVADQGEAHKMKVERSILLSARRGSTSSAADLTGAPDHVVGANSLLTRTTAGFIPIMEEDYAAATEAPRLFNITKATYTWASFCEDMKNIAYYQENQTPLYLFHGADVGVFFDSAAVNGFMGDGSRISIQPETVDTFGFNIRKLYTSECELRLVRTPALRGRYSGYGCVVDPRYVGIVKFFPDQYKTNLQANDAKKRKDEYYSCLGFLFNLVEKHALLKFS